MRIMGPQENTDVGKQQVHHCMQIKRGGIEQQHQPPHRRGQIEIRTKSTYMGMTVTSTGLNITKTLERAYKKLT